MCIRDRRESERGVDVKSYSSKNTAYLLQATDKVLENNECTYCNIGDLIKTEQNTCIEYNKTRKLFAQTVLLLCLQLFLHYCN